MEVGTHDAPNLRAVAHAEVDRLFDVLALLDAAAAQAEDGADCDAVRRLVCLARREVDAAVRALSDRV